MDKIRLKGIFLAGLFSLITGSVHASMSYRQNSAVDEDALTLEVKTTDITTVKPCSGKMASPSCSITLLGCQIGMITVTNNSTVAVMNIQFSFFPAASNFVITNGCIASTAPNGTCTISFVGNSGPAYSGIVSVAGITASGVPTNAPSFNLSYDGGCG